MNSAAASAILALQGGILDSTEVISGYGRGENRPIALTLMLLATIPAAILLIGVLRPCSCALWRIARAVIVRPWAGPLCAATISMLVAGAVATRFPPVPYVHDEFAYLLAADTWMHGRLTNPTPPEWQHFETFHVLLKPSYASKYPIGQGLTLALGQLLAGSPIFGVWLTFAAACAAVSWAARAWYGPRWGLVAGLVAATHSGFHLVRPFSWSQGFWGGGLALLGGALILGSWRLLLRRPTAARGFLFGAGLSILVVTRPWEGLVSCIPVFVSLAVVLVRFAPLRSPMLRSAAVGMLPLAATAVLVAMVNHAVTGSARVMPYILFEQQYACAPLFIFQSAPEPQLSAHSQINSYHVGWSRAIWSAQQSFKNGIPMATMKIMLQGSWYAEHLLLLFLPMPFVLLRSSRFRRIASVALFTMIATMLTCWSQPHYIAPGAAAFLLTITASIRFLSLVRGSVRRAALWLAAGGALSGPFLLVAVGIFVPARSFPRWIENKQEVEMTLEASPGKHIVLVRYSQTHNINWEWVYNTADMPAQKIIWARSMEEGSDRRLFAAFPDRTAWVVEPDKPFAPLKRLGAASEAAKTYTEK